MLDKLDTREINKIIINNQTFLLCVWTRGTTIYNGVCRQSTDNVNQ